MSYLLIGLVGFFPSAPPEKVRSRSPSLWYSFGAKICCGMVNSSLVQDFMHIVSFFASIVLFIINGFVAVKEGTEYKRWFSVALLVQLVVLVVFQVPIFISRTSSLSLLQCWFWVPYEGGTEPDKVIASEEKERNRRLLNLCASVAFLVECSLAACLASFGMYQELQPISSCVGIEGFEHYPWVIVMVSCLAGLVVGGVMRLCPFRVCGDDSCV
jgi:hypothetical protein